MVRTWDLLGQVLRARKPTLRVFQYYLLGFACKVILMGQIFSRRLFLATTGLSHPGSHVRVSSSLREDLRLWDSFLEVFNGHSMWQAEFVEARALNLYTDGGGSVSFGVFWSGSWCAEQWPTSWVEARVTRNITLLELFPVLVTLAI